MMGKRELLEWVQDLPDGSVIGIDDGGLQLHAYDHADVANTDNSPDWWLEIGGIPLNEEEDLPA